MKEKEYEKLLEKLNEQINISLVAQVGFLKEENEHLKEIIKLQGEQINSLYESIGDFFDMFSGNDKK